MAPRSRRAVDVVLSASGLSKSFGATTAVRDVTIEVRSGERVALLGPNGAGKTTTLLMLLGAIEPDDGEMHIAGYRMPKDRSRAMSEVGFVAGYLPLPQHLTVGEALEFFAGLYGIRRPGPEIDKAAERFRIGHLLDQRCETLSSGQRTLVGICKAILHHPRLVILDEPTASLDPDVAYRVREGLRSLSDNDGTALCVTSHNMIEVERLCERVIFISQGTIVAQGTPEAVSAEFDQADLEGVFLELAGTLLDDTGDTEEEAS